MRQALPVWKFYREKSLGERPAKTYAAEGFALWNHGQGHVFGDGQFERARDWFEARSPR
jgi:hypothetical protein